MKTLNSKLFILSLFLLTIIAVIFYPAQQTIATVQSPSKTPSPVNINNNQQPKVELVFALDTTGSMSGLIAAAKEKIWSIATTMASAQPAPEISIGLVGYRDRGDDYVTKVVDLSTDLDTVYARLMEFQADGGGDTPESVNQALYDAVNKISWSQQADAYKVIFLVGDAPPHMDYQDEVQYPKTLKLAEANNIIINTIQAGQNNATTQQWQQIAKLGAGDFFQVEQNGSALAVVNPYDGELAELSAKLDETRLYYGSKAELAEKEKKIVATKKIEQHASVESRARRAVFNASESGKKNFLGEKDLIDDVSSGRLDLNALPQADLPPSLASMAPAEQRQLIKETKQKREILQQKIAELSNKRSEYLTEKVDGMGAAKDESLDMKLFDTLKSQASAKGMVYEAEAPKF